MTDDDLERYAFSEAEREASEREMAERAAAARSAEMRAWAERRAVDRPEPAVQAPPPDFTAEWQSYITNKVARSEERMLKACMTAVGKALVEQRKELKAEFDAELMKLRAEFLQAQLDQERAKRVRTVPPAKLRSIVA